jgi:hypothetical protein
MAAGDYEGAKNGVVWKLYSEGWVRLGTMRVGAALTVEAEGTAKVVERRMSLLNDIAIFAGAELSIHSEKNWTRNMDAKISTRLEERDAWKNRSDYEF